MRLEDKSFPILQQVAAECKKMNKPLYAYFLVGTAKNVETVKMIGWPTAATMDTVEEKAAKLNGLVDGIIATCAGDAEGDKEMLQKAPKVQKLKQLNQYKNSITVFLSFFFLIFFVFS